MCFQVMFGKYWLESNFLNSRNLSVRTLPTLWHFVKIRFLRFWGWFEMKFQGKIDGGWNEDKKAEKNVRASFAAFVGKFWSFFSPGGIVGQKMNCKWAKIRAWRRGRLKMPLKKTFERTFETFEEKKTFETFERTFETFGMENIWKQFYSCTVSNLTLLTGSILSVLEIISQKDIYTGSSFSPQFQYQKTANHICCSRKSCY